MTYQNGKIYKITSTNSSKFYIGSTTVTLKLRLQRHINLINHDNGKNCSSKEIIEYGDYQISLLEDYPCNTKTELLIRENFYYDLFKNTIPNLIVNERRPYNSPEEKRENKRVYEAKVYEERKEYQKEYQKNNKEKIANQKREYNKKNEASIKLKTKTFRKNNKEKIALGNKTYRENNKAKIKLNKEIRYNWIKTFGGDYRFNNNLLQISNDLFN